MSNSKSGIREEFDAKAQTYETNRLASWYIAQLEVLSRYIEPLRGDVLDVGCGTGWLLRRLAEGHPQFGFLGIDISSGMVNRAQELGGQLTNLKFKVGDWESQLFDDFVHPNFECVVCTSALHYFDSPSGAVDLMFKALKPGGRVFVIERDSSGSPATKLWAWLHRTLIRDHVQFYTSDYLVGLLRHAGFTNVNCLQRVRRYLWHGKLQTSVVFVSAERPAT